MISTKLTKFKFRQYIATLCNVHQSYPTIPCACMHAGKKLDQAKEAMDNVKIMRHYYDLRTMCYLYNSCSGIGVETPPGTDCCDIVSPPYNYQLRPSPAGLICCHW